LTWYYFLMIFAAAALVTLLTTPWVIRFARRINAIDYPDNRRINTRPTPRLGGIALYLGLHAGLACFLLIDFVLGDKGFLQQLNGNISYLGVLAAIAVMFATGLFDDLLDVGVYIKVIGQVIAAIIAYASGLAFAYFTNPITGQIVELGWLACPITIFYLVAFANIINLIDGLDGLAAGIVAISAMALFVLSLNARGAEASVMAIALIGVCLAFLCFNFYPAKVFMGDSGSLLIGFTLGIISLFGVMRAPALTALLIPVIIAGIPVVDTFSAIIRRMRSRRSPVSADVEHMHHRLIAIGFNQRSTVLIMYALSALLAISACLLVQYRGILQWLIIILLAGLTGFLIWQLNLMKSTLQHYYGPRKRRDEQAEEQGEDGDKDSEQASGEK
jgi:UDP-GlcNAc:undecaprenyl-phosphate GlcNAc-1-phosphate transferase